MNPITYFKEKQKEKERLARRKAERERNRAEKELNEKHNATEKKLRSSLETAEAKFIGAMDSEDHVSAKQHATEMKSCENNLKKNDALKRQAERAKRLFETNALAAETLQELEKMTGLMKTIAGGRISVADLDKLRDSLEQNTEDFEMYAKESEEIIADLASIPNEDEVTDEELKAMKERYNASKAARAGSIKAPEDTDADKEIDDLLSALGGNAGSA